MLAEIMAEVCLSKSPITVSGATSNAQTFDASVAFTSLPIPAVAASPCSSSLSYSSATLPIRRPPPLHIPTVNQLNGHRRNSTSLSLTNGPALYGLEDDINTIMGASPKLNNRESELNSAKHAHNLLTYDPGKPIPSPKFKSPFAMSEMLAEPVEEMANELTTWEYQNVSLSRVPGYGFGIAVSGGKDNPHFKSGDPSIVISDVLKAGPAWSILHVNDRIISANSISLENVEYNSAVRIMKESEHLNMIIKRRVPLPVIEFEQRTLKFTLSKSKNKEDFGIVLGCKYYIKEILNPKLTEREPCPKEGDIVLKINGQNCDGLSLSDAQKSLEKSKEKLSIVIQRDVPRGSAKWSSQTTLYERLGHGNETPCGRRSPRGSPMSTSVYTTANGTVDSEHLNNLGKLMNGKYNRMAMSEYTPSAHNGGVGSHPPSRSRTPNATANYQILPMSSEQDVLAALGGAASPPIPPANCHQPPALPVRNNDKCFEALYDEAPCSSVSPYSQQSSSRILPNGTASMMKPPLPVPMPDARRVCFRKDGGSVGIRVIGGNELGIYVSAVQPGSPAAQQGVHPGDQILKASGKDFKGLTREEAVLHLLGLQDSVDLLLKQRKEEFERIQSQNIGDNFYIKVHFDYLKPENGEMPFNRGDIFQVIDTLYNGTVGSWQVVKFTPSGSSAALATPSSEQNSCPSMQTIKGVIPNASRAQQLAALSAARSANESAKSTGTFLRRRKQTVVDGGSATNILGGVSNSGRRSKSLTKGHWDEVVFGNAGLPNQPSYERVRLKQPGFCRPIVLFGGLSDIAREKLLCDFSLRFAPAQAEDTGDNKSDSHSNSGGFRSKDKEEHHKDKAGSSGIVRMSAIKDIVKQNKHCVLDVTPNSVEKLNYAQCYPIVIFLNVDSRSRLKDLRKRHSKLAAHKSSRKLMDQAHEIQKRHNYLFSAILDATHEDNWFEALRELIGHLQERRVWMSECRPLEATEDDFLFPMSPAISRYSSSNCTAADSDNDSLRDYSEHSGSMRLLSKTVQNGGNLFDPSAYGTSAGGVNGAPMSLDQLASALNGAGCNEVPRTNTPSSLRYSGVGPMGTNNSPAMMNGGESFATSFASAEPDGIKRLPFNRLPPPLEIPKYSFDSANHSGSAAMSGGYGSVRSSLNSAPPFTNSGGASAASPYAGYSPLVAGSYQRSFSQHAAQSPPFPGTGSTYGRPIGTETIHENLPHNSRLSSASSNVVPSSATALPASSNDGKQQQQDGNVDQNANSENAPLSLLPEESEDTVYENRESVIDYMAKPSQATSLARQKVKPRPPPRLGSYPPVPPKPKLAHPPSSAAVSSASPLPLASSRPEVMPGSEAAALNRSSSASTDNSSIHSGTPKSSARSLLFNLSATSQQDSNSAFPFTNVLPQQAQSASPYFDASGSSLQNGPSTPGKSASYGRHSSSERGMYDVKQLLANQSDYANYANSETVGSNSYASAYASSGYYDGSSMSPSIQPRDEQQRSGITYPAPVAPQRSSSVYAGDARQRLTNQQTCQSNTRAGHFTPPHTISNTQTHFNYPSACKTGTGSSNPVLRTASMPASTARDLQLQSPAQTTDFSQSSSSPYGSSVRSGDATAGGSSSYAEQQHAAPKPQPPSPYRVVTVNANGMIMQQPDVPRNQQPPTVGYGPKSASSASPLVPPKSPVPPPAPKCSGSFPNSAVARYGGGNPTNSRGGPRQGPELVPVAFPDNLLLECQPDDALNAKSANDSISNTRKISGGGLENFASSQGAPAVNSTKSNSSMSTVSATMAFEKKPTISCVGHTAFNNPGSTTGVESDSSRPSRPPRAGDVSSVSEARGESATSGSSSGLDLLNRDKHGGSAFELYKKKGSASDLNSTSSPASSLSGDSPRKAVALANCVPPARDDSSGQVCSESPLTDNHSVLAEVKATVDSTGALLSSPETGVSLVIPAGAIAAGTADVFFKVCQDKSLMPPLDESKGETLLSPLVMCGPQGLKFSKPIELRLPHKNSAVNNFEQWSFALKSTCPDDSGKAEWKNASLSEIKSSQCGTANDKFVSVFIDHF